MNYKMMGRFNAFILGIEAVFMIPALCIGLALGEKNAAFSFLVTIGILAILTAVLALLSRRTTPDFYAREGLICVGSGWLVMSVVGALPFFFSGEIPNYIDALFETVSGFTTTGASIITDLEPISKSLLYWRSFSHWLGGMGVLVFLLAVLPISGRNEGFTMHLLRAESPGPDVGKLFPRIKKTAMVLYLCYIVLSITNLIFLLAGGMPLFDAVCTMFGTAGTGGFGVRNDSLAGYSPYIQWVTTVFMLLFGINFSCYYLLLLRHIRSVFRDEELRLYLCLVVGSVALIAWNIHSMFASVSETVRHAAFQVASIITTTGYATTDFDLWPSLSKAILLLLMVFGACAGSTGGGLKCARVLLLMKTLRRNLAQIINPQKVKVIRVNGKPVSEKILANTNAYFFAYMVLLVASTLILSLDGFSITSNLTAVLACLNNIGPGLDAVGPTCNYAGFGIVSKLVLIVDMLAGRLEIFPILVLFNPVAWKRG